MSVTPHAWTNLRAVIPKKTQLPLSRGILPYFGNPSFLLDNSLWRAFKVMVKKLILQGFRAPSKTGLSQPKAQLMDWQEGNCRKRRQESLSFSALSSTSSRNCWIEVWLEELITILLLYCFATLMICCLNCCQREFLNWEGLEEAFEIVIPDRYIRFVLDTKKQKQSWKERQHPQAIL